MENDILGVSSRYYYLGLDIGRSRHRLFQTTEKPDGGNLDQIRVIPSQDGPQLQAVLITRPGGGQIPMKKSDLLMTGRLPDGTIIYTLFKDNLIQAAPEGSQPLAELIKAHVVKYHENFDVPDFPADMFLLTVGIPATWILSSDPASCLVKAARSAGFEKVEPCMEPVAAALLDLFMNGIQDDETPHSWLVIDSAGRETRFSLIHRRSASFELDVDETFTIPWGGNDFDRGFFEQELAPLLAQRTGLPNDDQRTVLLLLIREIKERFTRSLEQPVEMDFQYFGLEEPLTLSREKIEKLDALRSFPRVFQESLKSERLSSPEFQSVDRVILVGGNAYWKSVQNAVVDHFGAAKCWLPDEPDLAIARGLALAGSGFTPHVRKNEIIPTPSVFFADDAEKNGSDVPEKSINTRSLEKGFGFREKLGKPTQTDSPDRKTRHKKSWNLILWCVIIGAAFALLVSPIPCAAWPVLSVLEAFMLYRIATRFYGIPVTNGVVWMVLVGLLGISFVLSIGIGELVTIASAYIGGLVVKPLVAALVIWGLGYAEMVILDKVLESNHS